MNRSHEDDLLRLHYLGHAAFVLQFGGTTVLADYGRPNAWVEWGWDSPICDIGDLVPDVATYSHTHHDDHHDAGRLPGGVPVVVNGDGPIEIDDLTITPIAVHEQDLSQADNVAYLFTYRRAQLLHLGDCQADIIHVEDPSHSAWLRRVLPERCDVALMPIECRQRFFPQAEAFLRLLRPARAVPMHFWSDRTLRTFLDRFPAQDDSVRVDEGRGAQVEVPIGPMSERIRVVPLSRAPFRGWSA